LKFHIYILLLIGSLILVQTNVNAEKIIVDKKSTLNSILKAVKTAKPYDEIIINQGFYSEGNIIIDKPLRITGINEPIIDGD